MEVAEAAAKLFETNPGPYSDARVDFRQGDRRNLFGPCGSGRDGDNHVLHSSNMDALGDHGLFGNFDSNFTDPRALLAHSVVGIADCTLRIGQLIFWLPVPDQLD